MPKQKPKTSKKAVASEKAKVNEEVPPPEEVITIPTLAGLREIHPNAQLLNVAIDKLFNDLQGEYSKRKQKYSKRNLTQLRAMMRVGGNPANDTHLDWGRYL